MIDQTTKIVTDPIGLNEVADLLIEDPYLDDVCTSDRINMWAKWKPFKSPVIGYATIEETHQACAAANYGLIPFFAPNMNEILSAWDNNLNGWIYQRPTGGYESPFRLVDFAGYNHRALPPVSDVVCTENVNKQNTNDVLQINFDFESGGDTVLKMSDILHADANREFFPGVLMVKNGDIRSARVITTSKSINGNSDTMPSIVIANSNLEVGRWVLYPVYTPNAHTTLTGSVDTFYTMPSVKSIICNVTDQFDINTIFSEMLLTVYKASSTSIEYSIYMKAKSSNVDITDLYLFTKNPGATIESTLSIGEKSTLISSSLTVTTSGIQRKGTVTGLGTTVASPSGVFYITFKYLSNSIVIFGGMDELAPET